MGLKRSGTALAAALLFSATQAGAQTITFNELAAGAVLSNQYAALGVVFSANGLSGAGTSGSFMPWATNTNMIIAVLGGADVSAIGSQGLVSGNVLHGFNSWFDGEDGDPSFLMSFSTPVTSVSVTFAGVRSDVAADTRLLSTTGVTLAAGTSNAVPLINTQFVLTYSSATPFSNIVVAPGSYDDWVAVDNISFTQAVPEPAAWLLMAGGLGLLALRRKA